MPKSRTVLLVVVATAVLLTGCMGNGGDGAGGNATVAATATATGTPTSASPTETPGPPDAETIREDALAAMADVETYRIDGRVHQRFTGNINRTLTVNTSASIDRTARELQTTQVQTTQGREVTVETYVADGAIYSNSEVYTRQYSSEWIVRTPSNFTESWQQLDTVTRQRAILERASVSYNRTETVRGRRAYVIDADVDPATYERLTESVLGSGAGGGGNFSIERASFRFWIDAETMRPLRSTASIELTVSARGQTIPIEQSLRIDYLDYGTTVNVTLPEGADSAVNVSRGQSIDPPESTGATVAAGRP